MTSPQFHVSRPPALPTVVYDGDCRFCCHWAGRWRTHFAGRVLVQPGREAQVCFPEIPPEAFDEALQLVEPDRSVYSGAYAVLRARSYGRGRQGFMRWLFERVPGAAPVINFGYRLIARNRRVFSFFMR